MGAVPAGFETGWMQIEDLQGERRAGALPVAPPCPLSDGFHVLPWNSIDPAQLRPAWDHLARQAASPNPFFESWFLLPSLEAFDPSADVHLALLIEGSELVGLVPHWLNPLYHRRRLAHFEPWLHANMFCSVPLVAKGAEARFWEAYLSQLDHLPQRAWFLHLPFLPLDCPVTAALVSVCAAQGRQAVEVLRQGRALLKSGPTPEEHLNAAMTAKKRKELRRQRNRLDEEGTITFRRSRDGDGIDRWIDEFLTLELRSWKGGQHSAMASDARSETVFRRSLTEAASLGRLERIALYCDDRPIAMLASFLTEPGCFSFKTCFDEEYARYSPGLLLQIENLALLDDPDIAWCDSCAAADHPMIERIWRDRREIEWLSVGVGRGPRRWLGELWARIEARRWERRA